MEKGASPHAGEVASASNEQPIGITRINTAINEMDRVTQSNASIREETAKAASTLCPRPRGTTGRSSDC